jgi:oligosaccharide repeat unit polymerase
LLTLVVIGGLTAAAFLSAKFARSWLYPPALWSAYWAGVILACSVRPIGDSRLTPDALLLFLSGSLSFTLGGSLANVLLPTATYLDRSPTDRRRRAIFQVIVAYSIILFTLVPFFVRSVQQAGDLLRIGSFATAARYSLGLHDRGGIPRAFLSAISVGTILTYCAAALNDRSRSARWTLGCILAATLIMSGLTFARSPVYMLVTGTLAIGVLRGAVRTRTVVLSMLLLVVLAGGIGSLLGKGPDFATRPAASAVLDSIGIYFVGGPLGLSNVMGNPESVGEHGLVFRFLTQAAQSLGFAVNLPTNVLGYAKDDLGNVYTFYFAYWLEWRWFGALSGAALAGCLSTLIYVLARRGHPVACVGYGLVMGSVLNSAVGDGFFGSSIPWILTISLPTLLWHLPSFVVHRSHVTSRLRDVLRSDHWLYRR